MSFWWLFCAFDSTAAEFTVTRRLPPPAPGPQSGTPAARHLVPGLDLDAFFGAQFDDLTEARRDALALIKIEFFAEVLCGGTYAPRGARFLLRIAQTSAFGPERALYRWTHVTLLYALELLEKHGQLAPEILTMKQREKLQHDVIDMQYVVLGVLQGALASKDKRMRAIFRLLRPDGAVLPWTGFLVPSQQSTVVAFA